MSITNGDSVEVHIKSMSIKNDESGSSSSHSGDSVELMAAFDENFTYDTSVCFACGGFYGPSFMDPLCAMCHSFLFPRDWNNLGNAGACTDLNSTADDNDSGNDEPSDPLYSANANPTSPPPVPSSSAEADLIPPPEISYRLSLLTVPQPEGYLVSWPIQSLPPEILLVIFSFLDDLSLWSASQVCSQWKRLILSHVTDDKWKIYVKNKFPLYNPLYAQVNWYAAYSQLVLSSSCNICLHEISIKHSPRGKETSWRRKRLLQEVRSIRQEPPQGIAASPLDTDFCYWQASICGPVGSPYEGGLFYLYLRVPYSYPMEPPLVRFITRIFHPNISRHGDVGIDSINHNWSLALTISKVLVSIQSLLTDPYCQVCMEPTVGQLYTSNRDAFFNIARSWTWKYAMSDVISTIDNPS